MTMTTTPNASQPLLRQFRVGSTNLPDPDPTLSPEEVIKLYSSNYPALRFATLSDPRVEGDVLVIEASMPTAQTKG